jgi:hypothetical protein
MISLFFSYLIYIVRKYGILKSISQSYYELDQNDRWAFSFVMTIIGFCGFKISDTLLMNISGLLIILVGVFARFRDKITDYVHVGCAVLGILSAFLSLGLDYSAWWYLCIFIANLILFVGLTLLSKVSKKFIDIWDYNNLTWWIEIIAFCLIIIGLGEILF